MSASGDILFTETTLEKKEVNISSAALALSVFTEYRIGNFLSRISIDITSVPSGDTEYSYTGFNLRIGYIFDL